MMLYLLIPFLNEAIRNMSKKKLGYLVGIILCAFYIEPIFSIIFYQYDETEGFSLTAFVTLYIIGAYLAQCSDISKKRCAMLLVGSSGLIFSSKIVLQAIATHRKLNIGTGLLYHNNSIFVLLNAVALFLLFKQLEIHPFLKKITNWCTPSVFAVYLVHEKPIVRQLLWNHRILVYLENCGFILYMVTIVGISIGIFGMAIFIDKFFVNKILEKMYELPVMDKIRKKCDQYGRSIGE